MHQVQIFSQFCYTEEMNEPNEPPKTWLSRISETLLRDPHTRDELVTIIREGKERALIDQDTLQMIEGVLKVTEMDVRDIMIPRPQMVTLESDMSVTQALPIITESAHSRFPIYDLSQDKIIGILLAKDLLQAADTNPLKTTIENFARPATFIPDNKRLSVLLKEFRLEHNHMAIIVDEYGNIDGLITIEDVLEQIVGDIEDEYDTEEQTKVHIKQVDVDIAEVNALTPIEEFNTHFEKQFDDEEFDTIGGLTLQAFSHLPKEGETVEIEDLEITILKANKRGIQLLRIYRNPPKER